MPAFVLDDFEAMCDVLLDIWTVSDDLWNEGRNIKRKQIDPVTERNHEQVLDGGPILEQGRLESVIRQSMKLIVCLTRRPPQPPSVLATGGTIPAFYLDPTAPFILPPLDEDTEFIPLLSVNYEFGLKSYRVKFPVAMIRYIDDSDDFCGVGFRFESSWNGGNHDYFHVQPTSQPFEDGRFARMLPVSEEWLPTTYPCIPTGARCPVTLLFSLLISMYGKDGFKDMFLNKWSETNYAGVLKQYWK